MTESRFSDEFIAQIKDKIKSGMSVEDVIKQYGVSHYYVRKWTAEVYKNMDLDMYVRRRYRYPAFDAKIAIINAMASAMRADEMDAVSDETWDKWDAVVRKGLFEFAKDIVRCN